MLISFRGAIGCGKTTACNHLVTNHNFTRVSFADPLKSEVFDFLWSQPERTPGPQAHLWERLRSETENREDFPRPDWDFRGMDLYYISDDMKLQWVNERKGKLRPLLQWWGTEYRRAEDENYWVSKAATYMQDLLTAGRDLCMDDCRFDNELELIKTLGGKQVFIIAPEAEKQALARSGGGAVGIKGHASEGMLDPKNPPNDAIILNDGSLESLLQKVDCIKRLIDENRLYELLHQPL